jgi:iron(III) transport system ATP-binding protein
VGLRLRGLTKRFGEGFAAVRDLSLDVARGELVSLLGPSGCGKTTTLRLVAGFLEPDAGEIWVGDRRLSSPRSAVPPERRGMSMIFQSYAVWPHRSVQENVAYGLRMRGVGKTEMARRTRQALELVRLAGLEGRYPGELSGGQQQRVALARALVVEPEILLLDEPLSNLDANLREEMRFEIRRLHEALHITTLYVTHDQAEAMVTSDRVAVMRAGAIEQVGPPREIYERPATAFVAGFVGRTNLLPGTVTGEGTVRLAGDVALRVADTGGVAPPGEVAVSIRPHRVQVVTDPAEAKRLRERGWNVVRGQVTRAVYFGETMDVQVALADGGPSLRVVTRPDSALQGGEPALLAVAPEACAVLPRDAGPPAA